MQAQPRQPPPVVLETVAEVFDALGGNAAVMDLTRAKHLQTVTNWLYTGRFAAHTYLVVTRALEKKGCTAPPHLWGITDPDKAVAPDDTPQG